jgi:NADPH-dependent 2,4-dienoyl-CoA reductase/sulfur reductase-like enzyme
MAFTSAGVGRAGVVSGTAEPYGMVAAVTQRSLEHVVVVGASLAGLRAVETLRTDGFAGRVTLIGAEAHLPYDRPPLSKKLLAGDWDAGRITLRPAAAIDELGLDLLLGVPASNLDLDGRVITLADDRVVPFDGLVVATGSGTRRLPGQELVPTVHELRTLDDALALRAVIADGTARVVVVGAGFIGLEVAATARARGCSVTVLEGAPAPLIRGLGPDMGTAATAALVADGIDIRCDVAVADLSAAGVHLADGSLVPADAIVVGIGVTPATAWLAGSGLELRDGIVCDATLAAGPGVYAAGDVARWPNALFGEEMRVEHWTNAAEQGALAARNLLAVAGGGVAEAYSPVPFFWSDQGRHRIQFLGRSATTDDGDVVEVVVQPDEHRFLALYGRRGRLWGALGVNLPRLVMPYRAHLMGALSWDDALAFASTQQT